MTERRTLYPITKDTSYVIIVMSKIFALGILGRVARMWISAVFVRDRLVFPCVIWIE